MYFWKKRGSKYVSLPVSSHLVSVTLSIFRPLTLKFQNDWNFDWLRHQFSNDCEDVKFSAITSSWNEGGVVEMDFFSSWRSQGGADPVRQGNGKFTLKTAVTLELCSLYAGECCSPLVGCHSLTKEWLIWISDTLERQSTNPWVADGYQFVSLLVPGRSERVNNLDYFFIY